MTALPAQLSRLAVERAVVAALEEDLGLAGDLTSRPVVLETGGFSPWSAVNPIQNAVADEK